MSFSLSASGSRSEVRGALKDQADLVPDLAQRRAAKVAMDAVDEVLVWHPTQALGHVPDRLRVSVSGHAHVPGTATAFLRVEIEELRDPALAANIAAQVEAQQPLDDAAVGRVLSGASA